MAPASSSTDTSKSVASSWSTPTLFTGLVMCLVMALTFVSLIALAPPAHADDIRNREYWLKDSGISKAWEESQGEGVKIAVIDSGIDSSQKDLAGVVVGGTDVSGAGNSKGTKGVGAEPEHGTLVATMLAGRGHKNSTASASASAKSKSSASASTPSASAKPTVGAGADGVIGVAPKAQLLSVSVWLGSDNPSGKSIDQQIPEAVRWAVDNGAKVINMSLGSSSTAWPQSWDAAFAYAESKDVVIVAAAGNRESGSEQVGAPATIPGVLAVGGLDKKGKASIDSSSQGISIGVSAPAEDLAGGLPGGGYARWSGTSGAAPIVSGVAALIRSKYPKMSAAQVINRIISTATPAGEGHPNAFYGYGILNAEAALNNDVAEVSANPLGSVSDWIRVHRRGTLAPPSAAPKPSTSTSNPDGSAPAIKKYTVPKAVDEVEHEQAIPAAIVGGFGAVILAILLAGAVHLLRAKRKLSLSEKASADPAAEHSEPQHRLTKGSHKH